mmetsp:Transcript_102210/g.266775  ORF Transcript_102210/g.266775 Transcript_102210/m.266775 type:complete len:230 (-) Transcript_102210:335-1024(-)
MFPCAASSAGRGAPSARADRVRGAGVVEVRRPRVGGVEGRALGRHEGGARPQMGAHDLAQVVDRGVILPRVQPAVSPLGQVRRQRAPRGGHVGAPGPEVGSHDLAQVVHVAVCVRLLQRGRFRGQRPARRGHVRAPGPQARARDLAEVGDLAVDAAAASARPARPAALGPRSARGLGRPAADVEGLAAGGHVRRARPQARAGDVAEVADLLRAALAEEGPRLTGERRSS